MRRNEVGEGAEGLAKGADKHTKGIDGSTWELGEHTWGAVEVTAKQRREAWKTGEQSDRRRGRGSAKATPRMRRIAREALGAGSD
eukprot:1512778-Pleurochrysis_carterae.AAC.4